MRNILMAVTLASLLSPATGYGQFTARGNNMDNIRAGQNPPRGMNLAPNSSASANMGGFNAGNGGFFPQNNSAGQRPPANNNPSQNNNAAMFGAIGSALLNAANQNQQNQQLQQNQQPQNRINRAPSIAPNSSASQNQGNFRQPNQFQPNGGSNFANSNNNVIRNNQPISNNQPVSNNRVNSVTSSNVVNRQPVSKDVVRAQNADSELSDPPLAPRATGLAQSILIQCAEDASGQCHYELINESGNAYPYDISSGEKQSLEGTTPWTLRYVPAPGQAAKMYRLRGGKEYSLQKDGQGFWQLYLEG